MYEDMTLCAMLSIRSLNSVTVHVLFSNMQLLYICSNFFLGKHCFLYKAICKIASVRTLLDYSQPFWLK